MRVIGLAGWSGAGKTTLLAALIPLLKARGLTVSTLKHAHHAFEIDVAGKDSHRHRQAGATEVLIASGRRWALVHELRHEPEPPLAALLGRLSPVDLVIVEGFKREPHPKIELHREANGKPLLHPDIPGVRAIATDAPLAGTGLPLLDLNEPNAIAEAAIRFSEPLASVLARLGPNPGREGGPGGAG
jgi:molybdopterin-guanine dinucleotide biosynthesis adapter protein